MRKTTQSDATDLSERKNSKHDKQQNVYNKRVYNSIEIGIKICFEGARMDYMSYV